MSESTVKQPDCKYNKSLDCPPDQRSCWRCGWNPDISCERRKRLAEKLTGKKEDEVNEDH